MRPMLFPVLLLSLWTPLLHAAASLEVDDAGIAPDRTCQLETWLRWERHTTTAVAVPACTHRGTEFSLGLSVSDARHPTRWEASAKRPLFASAHAAAAAVVRHGAGPGIGHGRSGVALPVSIPLDHRGMALLHVQPGWERSADQQGSTFGVGVELPLNDRWDLLLERQRDAAGVRGTQGGLRLAWMAGITLDLLIGRRSGGDAARWFTVGLNLAH